MSDIVCPGCRGERGSLEPDRVRNDGWAAWVACPLCRGTGLLPPPCEGSPNDATPNDPGEGKAYES